MSLLRCYLKYCHALTVQDSIPYLFLEEYFDQWVHQAWMMLRRCLNLELSAIYSVKQYSWSNGLVGTSGSQWVQLLLKAGSTSKLNYVAPGHIQSSFFFFFICKDSSCTASLGSLGLVFDYCHQNLFPTSN